MQKNLRNEFVRKRYSVGENAPFSTEALTHEKLMELEKHQPPDPRNMVPDEEIETF